jgi:hypothetical protein
VTLKRQYCNVLDCVTAACEAALHGYTTRLLIPTPADPKEAHASRRVAGPHG